MKTHSLHAKTKRVLKQHSLARHSLLLVGLTGLACSSILGIEEIHEEPAPGSGGSSSTITGNTATDGDSTASGGTSGAAGADGDTTSSGGTSTSTSSTDGGGTSSGGNTSEASVDSGGSAGAPTTEGAGGSGGNTSTESSGGSTSTEGSGGTGTTDTTVHGRVINPWRQPVAGVTVMLGNEEVVTDADGAFEFADVAAEYDVMLDVRYRRYGNDGPHYGWVFEGLTRRDPTLQIYGGLPIRDANVDIIPNNVAAGDNRVLMSALGGTYGSFSREGATEVNTSFSWAGPETVTMTAHALYFETTDGLPTSYLSYDGPASPFGFTEGVADYVPVPFDMTNESIASGTISGAVASPSTADRTNMVYVRFPSNGVLQIVDHYGASLAPEFTYTVPSLPNGSITIAAREGTSFFGSAAVAYQTGVAPGATNVDLTIPSPPLLNAPASGTTLSNDTVFSWSGEAQTFVWHIESSAWYEGIYVVTARKSISMPVFPNGFTLRPATENVWRVESHGDLESVDAMAAADGFMQEFALTEGDEPIGPARSSGSFSISLGHALTMPP